jgi:hypothetical protein
VCISHSISDEDARRKNRHGAAVREPLRLRAHAGAGGADDDYIDGHFRFLEPGRGQVVEQDFSAS